MDYIKKDGNVFKIDPEIIRSKAFLSTIKKLPDEILQNGLAVRMPNHLGDLVMALPALASLPSILPDNAFITVIAPGAYRSIFKYLPFNVDFVSLHQAHANWNSEEKEKLRHQGHTAGILFNNSFRDALMMRLCGIKFLTGLQARNRGFLLKNSIKQIEKKKINRLAAEHLSRTYWDIVSSIGAKPAPMPVFHLNSNTSMINPELRKWIKHPQILTIAPGAAYGQGKRWDSEYFTLVAKYWIKHSGVVIITGNKMESKIADAIAAKLPQNRTCNLCGITDINDLMNLLNASKMVLANDSGVMHLAAALDRPGVAVFGSTDMRGTGPLSKRWSIFYRQMPCSPCFAHACPNDPKQTPKCLKQILPISVIREIRKKSNTTNG